MYLGTSHVGGLATCEHFHDEDTVLRARAVLDIGYRSVDISNESSHLCTVAHMLTVYRAPFSFVSRGQLFATRMPRLTDQYLDFILPTSARDS